MSTPKITDEEIDKALMANISHQWRKVAYVVMKTMFQIDSGRRAGLMDIYFGERVVLLVEKGFIEYEGKLGEMRECEVRLSHKANTDQN